MIQSSPANGIKRLDQVKAPPKALSRKEQYALLRAVLKEGRPRDYAIVQLLLQAGLRVGELCALRLADVEISERKGRAMIRQGKGQKWREVSLNADARKALSEYLATRPRVSHDYIFVGQRGEPLQPRGVQLMLSRHVSSAGLEGISPHSLRHTFGKSLVDAGVSLDRVAALMGHSKLDTTALYTRPTQADLDEAVERLSLG
jgi:site-specific recombinase XerD